MGILGNMITKHILINKETHRKLKILAATRGVSLIEVIDQVVEDYLKGNKK